MVKILFSPKGNPIGHSCKCKRLHEWPSYVFAHMNIELIHTCECGTKVLLINGTATKIKEETKNGKSTKSR